MGSSTIFVRRDAVRTLDGHQQALLWTAQVALEMLKPEEVVVLGILVSFSLQIMKGGIVGQAGKIDGRDPGRSRSVAGLVVKDCMVRSSV